MFHHFAWYGVPSKSTRSPVSYVAVPDHAGWVPVGRLTGATGFSPGSTGPTSCHGVSYELSPASSGRSPEVHHLAS
ncbi:hypothetical protein [Curtobacterium aetherium]|uniref:Uncharacterized protein n=1 Tax=Curtobacterium aetherium TaxID=2841594 RepID=A0ACD1E7K9_9MICO|nr:hypothetical protein [Curtobacterium sp. L6-1]QWS34845.1 hypothetical protein KM842_06875 [Curtobacterium sp. L6-1]